VVICSASQAAMKKGGWVHFQALIKLSPELEAFSRDFGSDLDAY